MTTKLLADFASRGIQLSARGDRLHYEGPVTHSDIEAMKAHKVALLAYTGAPRANPGAA